MNLKGTRNHPALIRVRASTSGSRLGAGMVLLAVTAVCLLSWSLIASKPAEAVSNSAERLSDFEEAAVAEVMVTCQHHPLSEPGTQSEGASLTEPLVNTEAIDQLVGTVVDRYGRPVEGASVRLEDALEQPTCATDTAGSFQLTEVQRPTATILIMHPGFVPTRRKLTSQQPGLMDLRLVLWRHPTLIGHGRVSTSTKGFDCSGISVRLKRIVTHHDGRRIMAADTWLACTAEDGTYTIGALLPGRYLVEARVSGASLQTAGFILSEEEVAAGGDVTIPALLFESWPKGDHDSVASAR